MITNQYYNMEEIWRPISGCSNYQISNMGRAKSLTKILKPGRASGGYFTVNVCRNGICRSRTIHSLVAQAFIDNPENKRCVNHKDGNKLNNHVDNLEWVTHSENTLHAFSIGLQTNNMRQGVNRSKGKISKVVAQIIRDAYACGSWSQRQIARYFLISQKTVADIIKRRTWITG